MPSHRLFNPAPPVAALSTTTAASKSVGRHVAAATPRRYAESLWLSGPHGQLSLSSLGWKAQPSSRGKMLRRPAAFGKAKPLRQAARQKPLLSDFDAAPPVTALAPDTRNLAPFLPLRLSSTTSGVIPPIGVFCWSANLSSPGTWHPTPRTFFTLPFVFNNFWGNPP